MDFSFVLSYAIILFSIDSSMKITSGDNSLLMLTRRNFLILCVAGAVACRREQSAASGAISLGPMAKFSEGATPLEIFRVQVMRSGRTFRAVSLICTHQTCLLSPQPEGFSCPCHGSQFDQAGVKLSGPAPKSLPWFELSVSPAGELLLHRDREVGPDWRLET